MLRAFGLSLLVACSSLAEAAVSVSAARVWPAAEYTRITLESSQPIRHSMLMLKEPERLVLDMEGVQLGDALKSLGSRIQPDDPYIRQVRVAYFKPNVVRLVVDLKAEVRPSVFALTPAGDYQHRLVLDIHPLQDPMLALLQELEQAGQPAGTVTAESAPAATSVPAQPPAAGREGAAGGTPQGGRPITVAIDAGHGGEDPGARGPAGTLEKNITLSIARKLKARIDAEPGMRAVLIRDGDYFIPLQVRVGKARKLQADLFISIHADAYTRPEARGSSVFALSERGATSAMARLLAQRENASDLIGGVSLGGVKDPYLARTLLDLSQTATISDSLRLGEAVLGQMGEVNTLHKHSVEQAGFAVLKSPDIPSILVETAFISNPEEERKLNDPDFQNRMADALLTGVKRYFAANPPLAKTRVAQQ